MLGFSVDASPYINQKPRGFATRILAGELWARALDGGGTRTLKRSRSRIHPT